MPYRTRVSKYTSLCILTALLLTQAGCETTKPGNLAGAYDAYHRGDFTSAYQIAQPMAGQFDAKREASYIAGLSAYRMRNSNGAIEHLRSASQSSQNEIAADANITLGRIYAERGRHADAANAYLAATPKLQGQARANAHYYAAKSQQIIGQWNSARVNFGYAKQHSNHSGFHSLINNEFNVKGWTLQIGAYSNGQYARSAAEKIAPRAQQLRMGAPRLVPATDKNGRHLVLVQVGTFTSQTSADHAKSQLNPKAAVVPMAMAR